MPDFHPLPRHADESIEDRFLSWVDELVDAGAQEQTPDPDFEAIASTARSIHRAAGVNSAPMADSDRTDAMWEDIMNMTPTTATVSPAPAGRASEAPARFGLPIPAPPAGWRSYLMTALLIGMIALASVAAAWRIAGPFGGNDGPEQANQPGVASLASPATQHAEGCPLTSDMIVLKESESDSTDPAPLLSTAVVKRNGDLVLICGGVQVQEPILTGVTDARSLAWPGTVLLELEGKDGIAFNVATGQQVRLGPFDIVSTRYVSRHLSPWLVTPNNAAHTDWRITNLRTMASMVLSDEIGGVLEAHVAFDVAWSPQSSVAIFTSGDEISPMPLPENPDNATIAELPKRAFVVDESLETIRWIDPWGSVAVSGDGAHIAYQPASDRPTTLRIEQSLTGEVVAEYTDINFNPLSKSTFAFANTGNAIVYLERNDVWLAEWDNDSNARLLDSGDIRPMEAHSSAIPGRVLLKTVAEPGSSLAIIDTLSGHVTVPDGRFMDDTVEVNDLWAHLQYITTMSPVSGDESRTVVTLVDIATGETVLTSQPIDALTGQLGPTLIANGGRITLVRLFDESTLYFNVETHTVAPISADPMSSLPPFEGATWLIAPTSNGRYLLAFATREPTTMEIVGVSHLSSEPKWRPLFGGESSGAEVSGISQLAMVLGVPEGPSNNELEPAVLEAQEIPPLEASPAANTASPEAINIRGCPLTNDMVILMEDELDSGIDHLSLPGTTAIVLANGDFVLVCEGVEDPVPLMTGVTHATSLTWPGVVLLDTESGQTFALDIATRNRIGVIGSSLFNEDISHPANTPWLLATEGSEIQIVNVRTMRSTNLIAGDNFPGDYKPTLISAPGSSIAVLAGPPAVSAPGNEPSSEGPEGSLHVVDDLFDTRLTINAEEPVAVHGNSIAYQAVMDGQPVIQVRSVRSDAGLAEIANINLEDASRSSFAFAADDVLVYLDDGEVWISSAGEQRQVHLPPLPGEDDARATDVYPSGVSGHVLVVRESGPSAGSPSDGGAFPILVVDTTTGDVTDLEGLYPIFEPGSAEQLASLRYVTTLVPSSESDEQASAVLTDIETGEVVVRSEALDVSVYDTLRGNHVLSASRSGAIAVINQPEGEAVLLNAETSTSTTIVPPSATSDSVNATRWRIAASQDGKQLYGVGAAYSEGGDIQAPDDLQAGFAVASLSAEPDWHFIDSAPTTIIPAVSDERMDVEPAVLDVQKIPPLDASPVATPDAEVASCDLAQDVPVVSGADGLQVDRTMLLLDNGTLTLRCNGEQHGVAEGVMGVSATPWPGAVLVTMEDGSLLGMNLTTGVTTEIAPPVSYSEPFFPEPLVNSMPGSRWMLIPGNADLTDWRIVDLAAMESLLLSDEVGGILPTPMMARLNTSGDTAAVITFTGRPSAEELSQAPSIEAALQHEGELPSGNAALVIVDSLENRRWTEASSVPEMSASTRRDDDLLALVAPTDQGLTIRVERLIDGELVADTGIDYNPGDSFFILDSARGLLHLTDERLDLVSWEPEPTTETLLEIEPGQGLPSMALTADPNVVVVSAINSIGEGNGYLVNIDTKEIIEVPNVLHRSLLLEASEGRPPQHVLAAAPYGVTGSQSTLRMIDVTTGEPVVTSDPIDMEPAQLQQGLSMLRANGAVGFSFNLPGRVIVLNTISGETYEFEMPTGIEGVPENHWWHVYPSYDGTFFLASPDFEPGSRHFFRFLSPNAEWIELPPGVPDIVRGT